MDNIAGKILERLYTPEIEFHLVVGQFNPHFQELKEKEEVLQKTTADYEAAKETEQKQYDAMKLRIRFMYEKGDSTYLQLLLESQNFGDMVNKADYVEQL